MRTLCLDIGSVRSGVSISDPRGSIATPLETVDARNRGAAVQRIAALVAERDVRRIVYGLPLTLDGEEGQAVRRTRRFADGVRLVVALQSGGEVEVLEWDERLTSVAAERALIESNVRRAKRKTVIDQVAATMILQSFLDSRGGE